MTGIHKQFMYPSECSEMLRQQWDKFQRLLFRRRTQESSSARDEVPPPPEPPFPEKAQLKLLLDVLYHVSFMREEGRDTRLRLAYLRPDDFESKQREILNLDAKPFTLKPVHPFTVSSLRRIAPAVDPTQSLLLVCDSSALSRPGTTGPVVWGILHLGLDWWRALTGRSSAAVCPPNCLTVSTFGPGNITASALGSVLLRLEQGKPTQVVLESISNGPIGAFLKPMAQNLYADAVRKLRIKRYHRSKDSDRHPLHQYYETFENIINRAAEKSHGATFVVVPDELHTGDQRLVDRIHIKYELSDVTAWNTLVEESVAHRNYFKFLFKKRYRFLQDDPEAKPSALKELIQWQKREEVVEQQIHEFEDFVASLSGVDGAVVLTTKFRVLGFGVEILAQSPSLRQVKVASDPEARNLAELDIDSFGTRHRSAFRLCSSFEDCIAFIVSQDGGIKAVKRVGAHVVLWPHVSVGRFTL